jgi:hypothetical protein
MRPGPDDQRIRTQLLIWWIVWAAALTGLVLPYHFFGRGPLVPAVPGANPFLNLAGFVPLFVSIVIRWLALPRSTGPGPALVMFLLGVSLAEAGGLHGIFLGGPYREDLFILGVMSVTQYVPLSARRFFEPKVAGYIPNN